MKEGDRVKDTSRMNSGTGSVVNDPPLTVNVLGPTCLTRVKWDNGTIGYRHDYELELI